jgi:hypothetical protein
MNKIMDKKKKNDCIILTMHCVLLLRTGHVLILVALEKISSAAVVATAMLGWR